MRKVKSLFLIGTVFVLCLFSFVFVGADEGGYRIEDYKFEGTYHKNNTVTVEETIKVQFTESRHGIYRTMPLFMEEVAAHWYNITIGIIVTLYYI